MVYGMKSISNLNSVDKSDSFPVSSQSILIIRLDEGQTEFIIYYLLFNIH